MAVLIFPNDGCRSVITEGDDGRMNTVLKAKQPTDVSVTRCVGIAMAL